MAAQNGLTASEEKTLRGILARCAALEPGRAYMCGRTRQGLDALMSVITTRLEPKSVPKLVYQAEQFFAPLNELDWARRLLAEPAKLEGAEVD